MAEDSSAKARRLHLIAGIIFLLCGLAKVYGILAYEFANVDLFLAVLWVALGVFYMLISRRGKAGTRDGSMRPSWPGWPRNWRRRRWRCP